MKVAVSACLLGRNCKYNGGNNIDRRLLVWLEEHEVIEVCPEVAGGLPTPRVPAELQWDGESRALRVVNGEGVDVTAEYRRGALLCYERVRDCDCAILKSKSPSCGVHQVYDGTFEEQLVPGRGVFAQLLIEAGIPVFEPSDSELGRFLRTVSMREDVAVKYERAKMLEAENIRDRG